MHGEIVANRFLHWLLSSNSYASLTSSVDQHKNRNIPMFITSNSIFVIEEIYTFVVHQVNWFLFFLLFWDLNAGVHGVHSTRSKVSNLSYLSIHMYSTSLLLLMSLVMVYSIKYISLYLYSYQTVECIWNWWLCNSSIPELEFLITTPVFANFTCWKFGKMAAQTSP